MVPVTLEGEGELKKEKGCTMFVDLGIYGISHKSDFAGREGTLRRFEKFTIDKGGFQALYAETLMNYEEFTRMFQEHDHYYQKVTDYILQFFMVFLESHCCNENKNLPFSQARSQLPLCKDAFPEVFEKVIKT